MTRLTHDPSTFADSSIAGFARVHRRYVRRVDGGVVRRTPAESGTVALVVGGGSGHYPAFVGLVGEGLAAGSVCGNIFASPSAGQVCRVAREAERGGGILLSFGNYAGDALNFGQAEQRLRAEGYDVRTVRVTDDIASAADDDLSRRRGIAGDLAVFKVAGASAAAGWSLDEVERVTRRANDRTRTIGVAFDGLVLPGSQTPLFSVPEGRMAVGMGIHGEPGLDEVDVPTPSTLAADLVDRLLVDLPADLPDPQGARAAVLVNGLGAVKYDELFVLFDLIASRFEIAGVDVVLPECGELVTSLEMPGLSLTVMWLDDELEGLWAAPADSPAFRRSPAGEASSGDHDAPDPDRAARGAAPDPRCDESPAFVDVAPLVLRAVEAVRDAVVQREEEFGRLDSVAGDGDHGLGMSRGAVGAAEAATGVVSSGGGVVRLLADAGEAWSECGGGTSGALWGIALSAAAASVAGREILDARAVSLAVDAALAAVTSLGGAEPGDKTMVDAFDAFATSLTRQVSTGRPLLAAWADAAQDASAAAEATAELMPRLGRARPHAEKSLGHPDPGAISFAVVVTTVAAALCEPAAETRGTP